MCTTLRKASRAVTRLYDDRLADSGMTITQFAVLRNLKREGDMALSRLAELLVMDRTSLYRTLAPIERHGWIRIGDGGRGRARQAMLTPAGLAAMEDATQAWESTQEAMIDLIGAAAWQALEKQLQAIIAGASGETAR